MDNEIEINVTGKNDRNCHYSCKYIDLKKIECELFDNRKIPYYEEPNLWAGRGTYLKIYNRLDECIQRFKGESNG